MSSFSLVYLRTVLTLMFSRAINIVRVLLVSKTIASFKPTQQNNLVAFNHLFYYNTSTRIFVKIKRWFFIKILKGKICFYNRRWWDLLKNYSLFIWFDKFGLQNQIKFVNRFFRKSNLNHFQNHSCFLQTIIFNAFDHYLINKSNWAIWIKRVWSASWLGPLPIANKQNSQN